MKVTMPKTLPVTVDVLCDVCGESTTSNGAVPQFGVLSAQWGYGAEHDGEHYELHLCERCFFRTLVGLKSEHLVSHMFADQPENPDQPKRPFGLKRRDDLFND